MRSADLLPFFDGRCALVTWACVEFSLLLRGYGNVIQNCLSFGWANDFGGTLLNQTSITLFVLERLSYWDVNLSPPCPLLRPTGLV